MKVQATIITDLIRMDIINSKLVNHFNLMGVDLEQYSLGIDRIVFELMDINDRLDTDKIFERYMMEYEIIMQLNVKLDSDKIEQLSISLYNMLDACAKTPVEKICLPAVKEGDLPETEEYQLKIKEGEVLLLPNNLSINPLGIPVMKWKPVKWKIKKLHLDENGQERIVLTRGKIIHDKPLDTLLAILAAMRKMT